jgi:hypothetical protein
MLTRKPTPTSSRSWSKPGSVQRRRQLPVTCDGCVAPGIPGINAWQRAPVAGQKNYGTAGRLLRNRSYASQNSCGTSKYGSAPVGKMVNCQFGRFSTMTLPR